MDVRRVYNPQPPVAPPAPAKPENPSGQVSALKRALDTQKDSAAELLRMLEPKGKIIDIRV